MITIEDVLLAEEKWTQAHRDTDVEALDLLMHPDYSIIKPDGSVWNKEKALASYVPNKRVWDFAESSDHYVRIYGDCAIVIGLWRAKGNNNGIHFDYKARYTSVWVNTDEGLRMVSDQSAELT